MFILSSPNSAASPQGFPKTVGSEAIGHTSLRTMLTRLRPPGECICSLAMCVAIHLFVQFVPSRHTLGPALSQPSI